MRSKWKFMLLLLAVAALAVAASGGGAATKPPLLAKYKFKGATFTVGSKEFTEQKILGEITKQALKATGAKVKDQLGLNGSAVVRSALLSGEIDMYWEYTGTGWIIHLKHTKPLNPPLAQWRAVAKEDLRNGVKWLAPAPMNNTYAFAVRKEAVSKLGGITKISQFKGLIARQSKDATICVASEFSTRDDGLPGVEKLYGFTFPKDNVVLLELGTIYKTVDDGKICNFGEVFSTDGRIGALGLKVLKDDKNFFPPYNVALNVRLKVFKKYPKLAPMFKLIGSKLTNGVMTQMNVDVDFNGKFPDEVAKAFLKKYHFIK